MADRKLAPTNTNPAVLLLASFAAGIFVDRFWNLNWRFTLISSIVILIVWLVAFAKQKNLIAAVTILLATFFAAAFWHHGRWNWFSENDLSSYCQESATPVAIRARILGEGKFAIADEQSVFDAIPSNGRTVFLIEPVAIKTLSGWENAGGRANLIVYEPVDQFGFGDEVTILGRLSGIEKPTTPGCYDLQNYYRARGITCAIHSYFQDAVSINDKAERFSQASLLSNLRSKLNELIWRHVDQEYAGFASAILLGNREQIPPERRELFLTTGTSHLLAISGLHVGILASLFLCAYRFGLLRRKHALLMTVAFVLFYAWLVEFRPPVVRAAILLSLFCFGKLVGRTGFEFNLLAVAGIIVLVINPTDLFQLGPQLSFLAVATLVIFKDWIFPEWSTDPIKTLIRNTRPWHIRWLNQFGWRCRQMFLVSLMIWLIGLPLVSFQFHLVTPVSIIANPLVMLPVCLALFSGLGVCVFGSWLPPVAELFGSVNGQCLSLVYKAIHFSDQLPWGHWWTSGPLQVAVVTFYAGFLCILLLKVHRRKRMLIGWLGCWILFAWLIPFQIEKLIQRNSLRQSSCTFVDVGHGTGVLLQLPYGYNMLYDAGSLSSSRFATATVSNMLWSEQIEHLDAVVISHADLDHFNAIPELANRFSIGTVYISYPMLDKESESKQRLLDLLSEKGITVRYLAWNDCVRMDGEVCMQVILPPEFGTADSDNSDSIVMSVNIGDTKLILPGDLEGNGMHLLLQSEREDFDVAMLPHHGSKNSRPEEFAKWCQADTFVVSAGRSKIDKVVTEKLSRYGAILTTAESGTIRYHFTDSGSIVYGFHNGAWHRF